LRKLCFAIREEVLYIWHLLCHISVAFTQQKAKQFVIVFAYRTVCVIVQVIQVSRMASQGGTAGSGHGGETPNRKKRGNRSTLDWGTLNAPEILANPGWMEEDDPWTRNTCRRYVDWAHINRHWAHERYEVHVKSGVVNFDQCQHPAFKKRLIEVALAIWGQRSKKDGTLSLCQMTYAEIFLGKDVDWTTFLSKSRNGQMPNRPRHIPPNPQVPLEDMQHVQENVEERAPHPRMELMEVEVELGTGAHRDQDDLIGGVEATDDEVVHLRQLVQTLQAEKEEALRQHAAELEGQRTRVQALMDQNVRLAAREADLVSRERRLSTESIPPLDVVVERATYGAEEDMPGPSNTNPFMVRPRALFPSVEGGALDAMRVRAERAEEEVGKTKASIEELTNSMRALELRTNQAEENVAALTTTRTDMERTMTELRALNLRLLRNPQREQMLLLMCNMKLACSMALNEAEQMQREVRRVAAEFNDGGQRYFGLTSWPRVEEMFPDTLPHLRGSSSVDWNHDVGLEFQFDHEQYRYSPRLRDGTMPLVWPAVPDFVKDGTMCIICQEPFGPEGGWNLGTCGHLYHPMCLAPHMVTRRRCAQCKAPFHPRLYKTFGLQAHMPEHYEHNEENLPGGANAAHWGKDMTWLWKWGHDNRHLPARTVAEIHWENDAQLTQVIKNVFVGGDVERRLYFAQMAGGHWDAENSIFVRAPQPDGVLFNSEGMPVGLENELSFEEEMAFIEDNTFNEEALLNAIFSHQHNTYDDAALRLLRTLQSREELQQFLRSSVARGIVIEEVE
jgi:hypothetical protein